MGTEVTMMGRRQGSCSEQRLWELPKWEKGKPLEAEAQDMERAGLPIQTRAVGEVGHGEGVGRVGRLLGIRWACD